ncbi:MAG: hypothetical protein RB191_18710, partial [Terriglobia bacterium]|nr:hypothetical protein [Terriglobia bacterium]
MKRLILAAFLLAMPAFGQSYGRLNFQLQTAQGQAVSGATIYVYSETACGSAAGAQAQLYSSATGGPIGQPLYTNGLGQQSAYAAPGCVTVVYSSPYTGQLTYPDQLVTLPSSGFSISVNSAAGSYNFNGATPAADSGYQLGTFKVSGSNVSVEVPGSAGSTGQIQ